MGNKLPGIELFRSCAKDLPDHAMIYAVVDNASCYWNPILYRWERAQVKAGTLRRQIETETTTYSKIY